MSGRGGLALGVAGLCGVALAVWLGWPSAPRGPDEGSAGPAVSSPVSAPAPVDGERARARGAPLPTTRAELSSPGKLDAIRASGRFAKVIERNPADAAVRPVMSDLRACHAAARAHDPAAPSSVTLALEVSAEGEITRVTSGLGEAFDGCAARLLVGARVPLADVGTGVERAEIRYPLTF